METDDEITMSYRDSEQKITSSGCLKGLWQKWLERDTEALRKIKSSNNNNE